MKINELWGHNLPLVHLRNYTPTIILSFLIYLETLGQDIHTFL